MTDPANDVGTAWRPSAELGDYSGALLVFLPGRDFWESFVATVRVGDGPVVDKRGNRLDFTLWQPLELPPEDWNAPQ